MHQDSNGAFHDRGSSWSNRCGSVHCSSIRSGFRAVIRHIGFPSVIQMWDSLFGTAVMMRSVLPTAGGARGIQGFEVVFSWEDM
jgi:hypothetical protein